MDLMTLRGVAMFLVALAPPGVAVFRHPGRGMRLTERFLLALALAPTALTAPALVLALALHLPPDWCLWQSEFLWIVAALWPRSAPKARAPAAAADLSTVPAPGAAAEPLPERGHGFPSIAALTCAGLAALLVACVSLPVPMVRMWSDAWFHAAATIEVARHGIPPQDPNFAGIPLYYPWIFHFLIAMIGAATRLSPFHSMALLNAWSAAVTVLAVAQLTYRAFGRAPAQWAGAIVVLGLDPFGWLLWLVRGMVGETTGLMKMIGGLATTNGATTSLSWLFPPSHLSLLNRFWTGTALTPAIALGIASAWSAARALERPTRGAWLRTLALLVSLFAMHPAYGVFAAGVVALGLVPALRERPGAGWAQLAACVLAVAAGLAWAHLCSPPGTTPGLRIGLYRPNLWSLLISIGPWWLIAAPSFRAARRGGAVQRLAAAGALAAAFMALFVVLPQLNTEKLFYLAWVSLVPLAAAGFVWWADRLRLPAIARVAVLAALVLPTAGLYAIGTASDRRSPGVLVRGDTPATRQMPLATGPEAAGYKFMRAQLPRDAVVIESARPTVNEPVPVLGERRVFCGSLNVYLSNHFGADQAPGRELLALRDEFYVRRSIQESLFRDAALNQTQSLYLEGFSQPLYLLIRRREVQDPIWEGFRRRAEWSEMLANEEIRLYRYEPRGVAPTLAP
jgi:hypothetical protein